MIFRETTIPGAWMIEPQRLNDERGFFARTWCREECAEHGLRADWVQCSVSFNPARGTLRGMHFQVAPYEEKKLVRCTRGAIYDVLIDVRADSPTHGTWQAFELTAENRMQLYIPPGVAHGFYTLAPETEVLYQISAPFHAESARAVRWNDPAFGIEWPATPSVISARDQSYGDYHAAG
jgi:dTDP-4-dehydrorhamnose 3,5-epimerase